MECGNDGMQQGWNAAGMECGRDGMWQGWNAAGMESLKIIKK
jgi:hypothetical protein